jgi:hypothetical protein
MKTLNALLAVVLLLVFSANAFSEEKSEAPTKDEALKAIKTFVEDPLSKDAEAAAATIVKFTEKSPDVMVVLSEKVTPWLGDGELGKNGRILLTAYIAGNVKAQLDARKSANDSYAGILQVIETYAQLKKADKELNMPEVEKLVELKAKDKLKTFVEEALEAEKKEAEEKSESSK